MMDWEIDWVEDIKQIEREELARQDRLNRLRGVTATAWHDRNPNQPRCTAGANGALAARRAIEAAQNMEKNK